MDLSHRVESGTPPRFSITVYNWDLVTVLQPYNLPLPSVVIAFARVCNDLSPS